jgi:hypothetical protein
LQIIIAYHLGLADIARQSERMGIEWMIYSFEPIADIPPAYRDRVVICDVSAVWETLQLRFPGKLG